MPRAHFHWAELARPQIVFLWILVQIWFKFSDTNNIENSTMYLMAKSDRDARRMVLIPLIGSFIGPLIWFIPSMAATITHPNLANEFPRMTQPHEAAFIAVARDVMPVGMMGLLLCAMLGATLTSMDAGLNKGVGVFVRSFYLPIINPKASDKTQLIVSKTCTFIFGGIIVGVAVVVDRFRTSNLFDLSNLPLALPLLYGMFVKRTPAWSAWSTVLVGLAAAYVFKFYVKPERFQHLMGWATPLSPREASDFQLAATTLGTVVVGSMWYFTSALFYRTNSFEHHELATVGATNVAIPLNYRTSSSEHHERVTAFFNRLRTPIDAKSEGIVSRDDVLYRLMGLLCIVFGGFITLLVVIPNAMMGRLCFVFCGGTLLGAGVILYSLAMKKVASLRAMERSERLAIAPLLPQAG